MVDEIMTDKERTDTQLATLYDLRLQIKKDTKETYTKEEILSKGKNSPFLGMKFFGQVMYTIVNGKIVYQDK